MCECVSACVHVCVVGWVCARARVQVCARLCVHACVHTRMRMCVCACMCVCVQGLVRHARSCAARRCCGNAAWPRCCSDAIVPARCARCTAPPIAQRARAAVRAKRYCVSAAVVPAAGPFRRRPLPCAPAAQHSSLRAAAPQPQPPGRHGAWRCAAPQSTMRSVAASAWQVAPHPLDALALRHDRWRRTAAGGRSPCVLRHSAKVAGVPGSTGGTTVYP